MSWNLEGLRVRGNYIDTFPVEGRVTLSRVAYGGRVEHTILLDTPIEIYGSIRERVSLEQSEILQVSDNRIMSVDN